MGPKVFGELILKWSGVVALVIGAAWGLYRWYLGGADDWMVNVDVATEVLPYSDDLRLLVVHVRSKNPTSNKIEFKHIDSTFTHGAVSAIQPEGQHRDRHQAWER